MDAVAMAPEGSPMDDFKAREQSPMINKDNSPSKKSNIRKRTKTGCMTCRKRRIKCDESKPICSNCIKSKRQCEGYNQRVVFKSPMGAIPGGPFGPLPYHHHPDPTEALVNAQLHASQGKASSSQGPLPIIAPKPPSQEYGMAAQYQYFNGYPGIHRANSATLGLAIHPQQYIIGAMSPGSYYAQPSPLSMTTSPSQMSQPDLFDFQMPPAQHPGPSFALPERRHTAYARIERPLTSPTMPFTPPSSMPQSTKFEPSEMGESWTVAEDSDSFDSEEEELIPENGTNGMNGLAAHNIGPLVANNLHAPLDVYGTQVRSFHSLAQEDVLVNYMPSPLDTPLNDPRTAKIFLHFVTITAPTINPYERNRPDPQRVFSNEPVPKSHQHIWNYVFAVQAFQHPGLLQAILALGSLQMAELSGHGRHASGLHYGRSIRSLGKNYQSATKRAQPATLAATLLLAFYEVWSSNHDKWCTHMIGARIIISETPLSQMSRQQWTVHRQRYQQWAGVQAQNPFAAYMPQEGYPSHELAEVDLDLVKTLTGRPVYFLEEAVDPASFQSKVRNCTERDLENYEHLADLYWWFCKMDVYQAFLGGSKLFMDYKLWTQCPPRAPINRFSQVYGTFDHLVLLLGRLSHFVACDLLRKRKVHSRHGSASPRGPSSPPMFPGLFPGRGSIQHPRGLSPQRDFADNNSFAAAAEQFLEDSDLETSGQKAMEEWKSILAAFNLFKASLGADFQPLGPDFHPPRDSPFGPALTYRTLPIAGVWMNFYMGLVILHRAHPTMPPFAMVAAHTCANETQPYANEIGKIVAGVSDDWGAETVGTLLVGSAYIECCFPLFVGAVQFTDKLQRQWAIRCLHDITRLTGWKTGNQIANGCEGAWRKAAAMGHAPPYEPESESNALRHGYTTRRIDQRIHAIPLGQGKPVLGQADRAHIAFGLLSVDEDFERLKVDD